MSVDGIGDSAFEQLTGGQNSVKLTVIEGKKMFPYAQTNLQLLDQMRKAGYTTEDLQRVSAVYQVALRLFTGYIQASGREQLAHVVGTSSILATLHSPIDIVSAGMLHNVYLNGDFGDGKRSITKARRKYMIQAVGSDVEQYLEGFRMLIWNRQTIPAIREELPRFDPIQRKVVLIRLADVMEQHCGIGGFYYHRSIKVCRKFLTDHTESLVQMAQELDFPSLAGEMQRISREALTMEIPPDVRDFIDGAQKKMIAPMSYKMRVSVALMKQLSKTLQPSNKRKRPKAVSST